MRTLIAALLRDPSTRLARRVIADSAPPMHRSLSAVYRRAVRARGHFPNDQAALKCLYLVTWSPDPWTPPAKAGHDGP